MDRSPARFTLRLMRLLLPALLLTPLWCNASGLMILTEENPPVSFQDGDKISGAASEVVEEIEGRVGEHAPIRLLPWARGYKMALQQPDVALFAMMRTPQRENLFKWVGPLLTARTSLYARRGFPVRIATLNDAREVERIIVPREYYSSQYLREQGFPNLDVVNTPEMMVRMLMAGRGSLMVADDMTLPALLDRTGIARSDVQPIYTLMESTNYIAFSRNTPDAVVQSWQRSLDDMKSDGSFARIYTRWFPDEASPGPAPSTARESPR